jgi:hypothetical protein
MKFDLHGRMTSPSGPPGPRSGRDVIAQFLTQSLI